MVSGVSVVSVGNAYPTVLLLDNWFMDTSTRILFEQGKDAFLQGNYRSSIQFFRQTADNLPKNCRESGEVQLWLVSALQANDQSDDAISLCRELCAFPFPETSQKAKRQLYILEAPKLERPKRWLTEIPSLDQLESTNAVYVTGKNKQDKKTLSIEDFEDLSQMETQDNQFVWIALGLGILGLMAWGLFLH